MMESRPAEPPKPVHNISRRSWIVVTAVILFVILFLNRFSVQVVSTANLFYSCFSVLPFSPTRATASRSLLSSDPHCDVGTVPVVVDIRAEHSQSDGQVTAKEGNLRLSYPVVTLNAAQNSGDHKFSARLAMNHKHKNRFCLHSDTEYVFILGSAEKAASLSGVHFKLCGEQFSTLSKQLVVRATQDSCSVREAAIASSVISLAAVDCTEDPTSAPTSMPTRFVPSSNTTSGNNQEIYETTTFISTVSAVGGTTLVATVGGVAYAAARSAKYFVQVPFAPEDLAMQI